MSTAKKPKVMVAMVMVMDGKLKPLATAGGRGRSTVAPSQAVSARPKANAASQCAAAIQRLRHARYSSTSSEAGASTCQSPSEAKAAIG